MTLTCSDTVYFVLFPTCIPVKGADCSIIMDLDKSAFLEIPNLLFEFLNQNLKENTVGDLKKIYQNEMDTGIEGYLNYLVQNQYGFFTEDPTPFLEPPKDFFSPYKIISSVLCIDEGLRYNLTDVFNQLEKLSCQLIQIRAFNFNDLQWFSQHLLALKYSTVRIIELFIPYSHTLNENELANIASEHERLKIIIYNAPQSKSIFFSEHSERKLIFTEAMLTHDNKEIYNIKSFTISYSMYYESLHYNAGINRKVCVDSNGNIKNYVSHKNSYGNVNTHTLEEVIDTKEFQKKYDYKNDLIEKCKDCQYRYMCISNSDIYLTDKKLNKIDTCNFDPYNNTWN